MDETGVCRLEEEVEKEDREGGVDWFWGWRCYGCYWGHNSCRKYRI